jgi:hypothetical protein
MNLQFGAACTSLLCSFLGNNTTLVRACRLMSAAAASSCLQLHYPFENKELFEANFPADFVAEGLDQTRGW